jgi:Na+/H+ antiporter NhaD/arsenite permease-like protein
MNDQTITLIIVLVTYVGVALGFLPRLRADRTTIALIGVGVLLIFKQVTLKDIPGFLDIDTLVLLFSMMVINSNLRLAGFFKLTGVYLLRLTRKPRVFLLIEIIVVGVLSALFLNDTICIMFTPFLLELLVAIDRNPIPYLIALATAANIGSVATLTGNPQNMIIGSVSGITYTNFLMTLAPIALICLGSVWIVIVMMYRREFARSNFFTIPPAEEVRYYKPLLLKSSIVVAGMLTAFLAGVPVALASFIAACVLMITRRIKPEKIFAGVDWGILAFFSALFIITGALDKNNVTTMLLNKLNMSGHETALNLSLITVTLSNLVSNVPAVMLLKPLVSAMPNPTAGWYTLAAASTLAGNLTLLGSVANLIVAESAKRRKVVLSFWEYTKSGLIITILTLMISTVWIMLFIWK